MSTIGPPVDLVVGCETTCFYQAYLRGVFDPQTGAPVPAAYNATDIVTAAVVASRQTVPVFTPFVAWYTGVDDSQTGYEQGQVAVSYSTANMVLFVPTIRYTLLVYRALLGAPSVTELIMRVPLTIEMLAIP